MIFHPATLKFWFHDLLSFSTTLSRCGLLIFQCKVLFPFFHVKSLIYKLLTSIFASSLGFLSLAVANDLLIFKARAQTINSSCILELFKTSPLDALSFVISCRSLIHQFFHGFYPSFRTILFLNLDWKNVMVIPSLKKNLLSNSQLTTGNSYVLKFNSTSFVIKD